MWWYILGTLALEQRFPRWRARLPPVQPPQTPSQRLHYATLPRIILDMLLELQGGGGSNASSHHTSTLRAQSTTPCHSHHARKKAILPCHVLLHALVPSLSFADGRPERWAIDVIESVCYCPVCKDTGTHQGKQCLQVCCLRERPGTACHIV